jgi:hypothetical protein
MKHPENLEQYVPNQSKELAQRSHRFQTCAGLTVSPLWAAPTFSVYRNIHRTLPRVSLGMQCVQKVFSKMEGERSESQRPLGTKPVSSDQCGSSKLLTRFCDLTTEQDSTATNPGTGSYGRVV